MKLKKNTVYNRKFTKLVPLIVYMTYITSKSQLDQ